ncbi:putative NADH-dependent flavin oxidoreductase YqiG [Alphaproteobacteria bacterium]|nr:putative NADH-dependent flavin oxidoreductase YqiG [Alphaproteobacteria bacterium]
MKPEYAPLFSPLKFANGLTARNRVVLAPMTHFSANEDGSSTPEEIPYIRRRAKSVGIAITPCYAVTPNGKAYTGEPSIAEDRFIPDLCKMAEAIHSEGAIAVLQLHHGGGVCPPELVPEGDVVAPSAVGTPERSLTTPRALQPLEITALIDAFAEGARRALQAGFDGVELHGGYGYLLQQFASPYTNRRADHWGDRFSFPLAVIKAVRSVAESHAKFLVGYRFTPEEALEPGLTMADALAFTEALVNSKVDFIDVLVNDFRSKPRAGIVSPMTRLELISRQVAGRTILLGGGAIGSADDGLAAIRSGIDMITLARQMIVDPEWAWKITQGREDEIVTVIKPGTREELEIPSPFWRTIWATPGWFPGTEKQEGSS